MEKISVILRAAIVFAGSFFLGKVLFGQAVDNVFIDTTSGIILSAVGFIWSIKEKSVTADQVEGIIRQSITFIAGLLVSSGLLKNDQATELITFAVAGIPVIQSYVMRWKNSKIAADQINKQQLKK
jgi:hypothetical protein